MPKFCREVIGQAEENAKHSQCDQLLLVSGLLIQNPKQRYAKEALKLLASFPSYHLRPSIVRNAVFAWFWIIAAVPELRVRH